MQKRHAEAVAAFRKATELKPDFALAYSNLGVALGEQKRHAEAVAAFRKAIALQPDYASAYVGLGIVLVAQKRPAEAVAAFRKATELLPNRPAIRNSLRHAERLLALEEKLSAVLADKDQARTVQERVELARFCSQYKQHYVAAVRFFSDAFAAEPKLAADLARQHRYTAACSAALAAAWKGEDAGRLPARVLLTLRRQALRWLRADLEAYAALAGRDNPPLKRLLQQRLEHWQQDAALATVRDEEALAGLPDHERAAWCQLWADVAALLKKVADKP
jgi:predicted O-linked N-acetylglucosamine transferase (SPINDLY family)